jgi:hypothetical protein
MNINYSLPKSLGESSKSDKISAHLGEISCRSKYFNERHVHSVCRRLICSRVTTCSLDAVTHCTYFLQELQYLVEMDFEVSIEEIICPICKLDVSKRSHGNSSCREFRNIKALRA